MSNLVKYSAVREQIRDGDGLFYRCDNKLSNRLIGKGSASNIVHVGMAAWWGDRLFILETLQWKDCRAVLFSSQVEGWPEKWDWYPIDDSRFPDYDREGAVEWMKKLTGTPYGWGSLFRAGISMLPVIRLFIKPDVDDSRIDDRPPCCSVAVALADKLGGKIDPVNQLSDATTSPAHLARSKLRTYQCTLF